MQRLTHAAHHPVGPEICTGWRHDDGVKNLIKKSECSYGNHKNKRRSPDKVPAQSFEVLKEGHFALLRCLAFAPDGVYYLTAEVAHA